MSLSTDSRSHLVVQGGMLNVATPLGGQSSSRRGSGVRFLGSSSRRNSADGRTSKSSTPRKQHPRSKQHSKDAPPSSEQGGSDADDDDDGDEDAEMSMEMKAKTLGYQLPTAEMEILRLEEMQRGFEEKLHMRKKKLPSKEVNLAHWLEKHPEVTLSELNLADSSKPIKSISVDDALGTGRYVMRGELKKWMETVEQLNSGVKLDAREWDSDDEREVEESLNLQMKEMLSTETKNRRKAITALTYKLTEMIAFLSEREDEFIIDEKLFLDEESKLEQLVNLTGKWYEHVKKHGHPRKEVQVEDVRAPTEEELRRRQIEQGLTSAAFSQGILLQPYQVDQVLSAFYEQKQPESSKKKDRSRIEKRLVESLSREENKSLSYKNTCNQLREKIATLEATVYQQGILIDEMKETKMLEMRDPVAIENMNAMTRTVAEVLARKKVDEAEKEVQAVMTEYDTLKAKHVAAVDRGDRLETQNSELKKKVQEITNLWKQHKLHIRQQEEERKRMYGGHKDDKDHFINTIASVLGQTTSAFMKLMVLFTSQDRAVVRCDQYVGEQQKRMEHVEDLAKNLSAVQASLSRKASVSPGRRASLQVAGSIGSAFALPQALRRPDGGAQVTPRVGGGDQLLSSRRGSSTTSPSPAQQSINVSPRDEAFGPRKTSLTTFSHLRSGDPFADASATNVINIPTSARGGGDEGQHNHMLRSGSITKAELERQMSGKSTISGLGGLNTSLGGGGSQGSPLLMSTSTKLLGQGPTAINNGMPAALGAALTTERRELSEYEAQRKTEKCGLNDARAIAEHWARNMLPHALTDGLRISLQELVSLCQIPTKHLDATVSGATDSLGNTVRSEITPTESKNATVANLNLSTVNNSTSNNNPNHQLQEESRADSTERSGAGGGGASIDKVDSKDLPRVALRDIDLEKEHLSGVSRRLDTALAELRSKYREIRYMRTCIKYLVTCFEAMCNGSYDDMKHAKRKFETRQEKEKKAAQALEAKRKQAVSGEATKNGNGVDGAKDEEEEEQFPPLSVTTPDSEYHYAWGEEMKLLENLFMTLRHVLCDSGERADTSNALINALETVADAGAGSVATNVKLTASGGARGRGLSPLEVIAQREANLEQKLQTAGYGEHQSIRESMSGPQTVQVSVAQQKVLSMLNNMNDTTPGQDARTVRYENLRRGQDLHTSTATHVSPGAALLADTHRKVFQRKVNSEEHEKAAKYLDKIGEKQVKI